MRDLPPASISLSLKQANEGTIGEAVGDDFDPTLYGMPASYDEQGNYEYPDGFDPETGEWLPGYEKQREEWEHQYAEARARFEAHRRQVEESRKAADEEEGGVTAESGDSGAAAANGAPRSPRTARSGGPAGWHARRGHLELDPGDRDHRHPGFRRGPGGPAREAVRRPELDPAVRADRHQRRRPHRGRRLCSRTFRGQYTGVSRGALPCMLRDRSP